jgi:hypothetical protein
VRVGLSPLLGSAGALTQAPYLVGEHPYGYQSDPTSVTVVDSKTQTPFVSDVSHAVPQAIFHCHPRVGPLRVLFADDRCSKMLWGAMLIGIYCAGWVLTSLAALVAAKLLGVEIRLRSAIAVAFVAGALWPLVVVGAAQLGFTRGDRAPS